MRKLSLLILLLPFISYSQEVEEICDYKIAKINDSTYKVQVSNFDSLSSAESCFWGWMNNGKGKPDGALLVYDENGKKRRLSFYKEEIRVGTHLEWYSTGELESEVTWETDNYFNSKSYYKSGKIRHTSEFGNRDNAIYKLYYENGQLESLSNWSNDIENSWYENGKIKSELKAKGNTYREWHENGKIKVEGKLKYNWKRIGRWLYYNEEGKLARELFYEDSKTNDSYYHDEVGFKKEKKY